VEEQGGDFVRAVGDKIGGSRAAGEGIWRRPSFRGGDGRCARWEEGLRRAGRFVGGGACVVGSSQRRR
jgi:hypothetical protein